MTTFDEIENDAKANDSILGLILVGSRGKGFENEHSDTDAILIAADGAAAKALQRKYADAPGIDLMIFTLAQFEAYAAWGSPMAWDRYNFAHVKLLADKTARQQAWASEHMDLASLAAELRRVGEEVGCLRDLLRQQGRGPQDGAA